MRFRSILPVVLGLAIVLALLAGLLSLGGFDASRALTAFWSGSFGGWYAFTSGTLVRAIPLMLTGCAVAVAFRAGVFNIGAEGQLLAGASSAAGVALVLPHAGAFTMLLALAAGAGGGAVWAGIAAWLRERFGVLEVISTIMLNSIALYGISYLVRGPLQEPTHAYPQSLTIEAGVRLPQLPSAGRLHLGILLAVVLLLLAGWLFRRSAAGFRLLAVGENPYAAASAGLIDVAGTIRFAFLLSGAFAGLAGAIEVLGVTYALYEDISPGYGYTAIAVALLAGLDPWRVIVAALFFAGLESGAGAMQRDVGIPATLVAMVEATVILAVIGTRFLTRRQARFAVVE